jgi:hypothetical protein
VTAAARSPAGVSGGSIVLLVAVATALLGCGSDSNTPAGPTRPPAQRVSTAPAASRSPGPSPSRDPGQAALTSFFTLVTGDRFAYQATFTGESHHTVDILPMTRGLLQVNGDDVLVRTTFTFKDGTRVPVEHRSVGGRGWLKVGAASWKGMTKFGPANSMAAFAAVHGPPDITYVGPVKSGGKTVYRVSMPSVIVNPIMIPASNLTEIAVTASRLTLLIDAAGRPLSGSASITGRGRVSGQLQEIVIELKLTFIKVGQKVTIAAP